MFIEEFDEDQSLQDEDKNDFQLFAKEIDAKVAKIALSSTRFELSAI